MVRAYCWFRIVLLLITADLIKSLIQNKTIHDVNNNLKVIETRRNNNLKPLSTSSESGDHRSEESSEVSLGISSLSSTSSSMSRGGHKPKSSEERKGWRKWHRKCTPCPDDMVKKWRDRSIRWICGGYQRARRSFKSDCMMRYRNCQDGTMFVKLHDHRCQNDTLRHGLHFFYEYGKDSQDSKAASLTDSSYVQRSSELYT